MCKGRGSAVLPGKLNVMVSQRGAVLIGRNIATLWAGTTTSLMAHSVRCPHDSERGCLAGCWGAGDHVCKRRGQRVVCGLVSRAAHWGALGSHAEKLGMLRKCGTGAGNAWGLDRGVAVDGGQ